MALSNIKMKTISEFIYYVTFLLYLCFLYIDSEIAYIFELVFYGGILIYLLFNFGNVKLSSYLLWQLLFVVTCFVFLGRTYSLPVSIIEIRKLVRITIIGVSLISFIDSPHKLRVIYNFFVIAGLFLLVNVLNDTPVTEWFSRRLGGSEFGYNANEVGLALSISVVFALYLGHSSKKSIYYLISILLSVSVLLTGSRKSLILTFLGIAGLLYFNSKGLTNKVKMFLIGITLVGLGYYLIMNVQFLYEITGSRVQALMDSLLGADTGDNSTQIRSQMVEVGLDLFSEKPMMGHGLGSFAILSGFYTYSHNNYIELLSNVGVIGLSLYYLGYIYILIKSAPLFKRTIITPVAVLFIILIILEIGLVTYNEIIYQLIIILLYAGVKLAKTELAINRNELEDEKESTDLC